MQLSAESESSLEKLAPAMLSTNFDHGLSSFRFYYRTNIFTAPNILKLLDQNGGQLSMTGVDLLRTLETNNIRYSRKSIFPSITTIRRCATVVDNIASVVVPFKEGKLDNGVEYCEFEVAPVVNMMLKGYQLDTASKSRSIVINQAIDGARLANRLHHTTYGLKMSDRGARDPVTGNLIYGSTDKATIQSKHYCHPIKIVLSHENKEIIEEFRDVIDQVKSLTNPENSEKLLHGSKPITTFINADMSAQWKLIKRGHAVKRGEGMPCHICSVRDEELHVQNAVRCERWCNELHLDKENWNCYHQKFLDEDAVDELREDLKELKLEITDIIDKFEEIRLNSDLNMKEDPREPLTVQQRTDNESIHFNTEKPGLSKDTLLEYEEALHLQLRNIPIDGTIIECQQKLKKQLIQEHHYKRLTSALNHVDASGTDGSFILLADCPPCILHMEMQTVLKFLQVIVHDGLKYARHQNKSIKNIEAYASNVKFLLNCVIFGTLSRPATFNVKYNQEGKVIDDITLDGGHCRKLIHKIQPVLDLCIRNSSKKQKWENIIKNYILAFDILRSKEDLEKDEIKKFQYYVDIFYQDYLELYSREGVTNYFHMFGSGHVSDYLLLCGNLYIHSQQGWEAFNSFLKVYYFRRTNRGGGRGSESNRLRPIAKWLGRRLIWNSGYSYEEFTTKDVFRTNKIHADTCILINGDTSTEEADLTLHENSDLVLDDDEVLEEDNTCSEDDSTCSDYSSDEYDYEEMEEGTTDTTTTNYALENTKNEIDFSKDKDDVLTVAGQYQEEVDPLIFDYACSK